MREKKPPRQYIYWTILILVCLSLVTFSVVAGFRVVSSCLHKEKYYIFPPKKHNFFTPLPEAMPGVRGKAGFYVNSHGLRGDEPSFWDEYRILAMGGSSTECLYLDQYESWPYMLQDHLNDLGLKKVWVGNSGSSGRNCRDHIMHMMYLLPQLPDIDLILLQAGVNDFVMRLERDVDYDPDFLSKRGAKEWQTFRAFNIAPPPKNCEGILIWVPAGEEDEAKAELDHGTGVFYVKMRDKRKSTGKILNEMPDLTSALSEYERNLNILIDMAEIWSIRLVFMTQPSMWKKDMTPYEEGLIWMGWKGQEFDWKQYYSVEVLAAGIKKYNDRMIKICKSRGVEYIDLAELLPRNTQTFYDDVHFNENGSRMVADQLLKYLSSKEPFIKR